MNGKRAKSLRKRAAKAVKDIKPEDHDYTQEQNCLSMEQAIDPDGKPMEDGDGMPLLAVKKRPGTLHHAQPFMILYKILKRNYYKALALERGSC